MNKHNKGFTLIELLVVIAIISLLSSIVLASLNGARTKARLTKALATMNELNKVAYMCASENSNLIMPALNGVGGSLVCPSHTDTLPNITDTGFSYCGTGCGAWFSTGTNGSYVFSIYSDSYPDGRKVIVCGSDFDASSLSWFGVGFVPAWNFSGSVGCGKFGF